MCGLLQHELDLQRLKVCWPAPASRPAANPAALSGNADDCRQNSLQTFMVEGRGACPAGPLAGSSPPAGVAICLCNHVPSLQVNLADLAVVVAHCSTGAGTLTSISSLS
jgi:hypothetical protein